MILDFNYGEKNGLEIICSMLEFCGEELTDPLHKNSTVLYKSQNCFFMAILFKAIYMRFYLFIYLFLALLLGTWDLSSLTGDQTCSLHWKRVESWGNQQTTREAPKETKLLTNFLYPVLCHFLSLWPQVPCAQFL